MNCTSKYFEPKPRILTISGFSNTRIWDWKSCRNLKNHQPNLAYKSPNFSLFEELEIGTQLHFLNKKYIGETDVGRRGFWGHWMGSKY